MMRSTTISYILFIFCIYIICISGNDSTFLPTTDLKSTNFQNEFNSQVNSILKEISCHNHNDRNLSIHSSYIKNPYRLHQKLRSLLIALLPSLSCVQIQELSSPIAKGTAFLLILQQSGQLPDPQCSDILSQVLSWEPQDTSQCIPRVTLPIIEDKITLNGEIHNEAMLAFEKSRRFQENSKIELLEASFEETQYIETSASPFLIDMTVTNSSLSLFVDFLTPRNFSEISYNFKYKQNSNIFSSVINKRGNTFSVDSQGIPIDSLANVTLNETLPLHFSAMTYNIWNFNRGARWDLRVQYIAQIINKTNPDIVALQELRDDWYDDLPNQISDLASALPQYRYWRYTPAQIWNRAHAEEGIGIMSKYPFVVEKVHNLPLVGEEDHNQRILVKSTMKHAFGFVDVFTTHWSFDTVAQMNQSEEAVYIMSEYDGFMQLLMGDLNIYSDSEEPANVIKNLGGFSDCWESVYNLTENRGLTFSTLPNLGLHHRADRIFYKSKLAKFNITVTNAQLFGGDPINGTYPSDHFALFAQLNISSKQLFVTANVVVYEEWILNLMLGVGVSGLTVMALMICLWSQKSLLWDAPVVQNTEPPKPV